MSFAQTMGGRAGRPSTVRKTEPAGTSCLLPSMALAGAFSLGTGKIQGRLFPTACSEVLGTPRVQLACLPDRWSLLLSLSWPLLQPGPVHYPCLQMPRGWLPLLGSTAEPLSPTTWLAPPTLSGTPGYHSILHSSYFLRKVQVDGF